MPELPEVEMMRRGVLSLSGGVVVAARRLPCSKRPIVIEPAITQMQRRLKGRRLKEIDRLGKRLVLVFDDRQRLVFEPRMTGLVTLGDAPNREHLRFELQVRQRGQHRLRFWDRRGLGVVRLYRDDEFVRQFLHGRIGPDALSITPRELQQRAGTSKRPIKVALLDQKLVAGIGNLYAAEILHHCQIDPRRPCCKITLQGWQKICRAIRKILTAAIQHEGSTLSDGTYRNKLNEPAEYQNHHRVYDREGEKCLSCGKGLIRRIVQAQRSTFFCPNCQRR